MTIKDTCKAVRAMGLTCRWRAEWNCYRIDYRRDDPRYTGGDLGSSLEIDGGHTRQDRHIASVEALSAARMMIHHRKVQP